MKQERLNLYRIDMKYIRNLHNIDELVWCRYDSGYLSDLFLHQ